MVRRAFLVALAVGCGGSRGAAGSPYVDPPAVAAHSHNDSTIELPPDEVVGEPEPPPLDVPTEAALVHVHAPRATCSGTLVTDRVVVTAHQCLGDDVRGISAVPAAFPFYVEVPTPARAWNRKQVTHSITGGCLWERLDLAMLVLADPVEHAPPMRVVSPPETGAMVQAFGFGRCRGETRGLGRRFGQLLVRESDALIIGVSLCRGDVGGPVVLPAGGDVLGIISHQDDPDDAPRRTTTLTRLDSLPARALLTQALAIVKGEDPSRLGIVACE